MSIYWIQMCESCLLGLNEDEVCSTHDCVNFLACGPGRRLSVNQLNELDRSDPGELERALQREDDLEAQLDESEAEADRCRDQRDDLVSLTRDYLGGTPETLKERTRAALESYLSKLGV